MQRLIHIKGFTLMELLVAMVLTGLIMMVGISAISYFMRLVNSIKQNNECQTSILLFYEVLKKDVDYSERVLYDGEVDCYTGDNVTSYLFEEKEIIRIKAEHADTFRLEYNNPVISCMESAELVNHITIDCKNNGIVVPLDIYKSYPPGFTFETTK